MNEKINTLLSKAIKQKEFDDRLIVYIEKEDFKKLWEIYFDEVKAFISSGYSEKYAKQNALKEYVKIINPGLIPIKVVSFFYNPAYSLVSNQKLILEKYIDKEFAVWANKERKNAKRMIKTLNIENEAEAARILDKTESEIKKAQSLLEEIKANPDKFELLKTNFRFITEIYKPYIGFYNGKTKKFQKEYLRQDVPNVVWEEEIVKKKKSKLKIDKKLDEMQHLFGYIYVKVKDGD